MTLAPLLEPTQLMSRPGAAYRVPFPTTTGNATHDRLVLQAYRRLQSRLARGGQTAAQVTEAIDQYRRVVMGITAPGTPDLQ
ncbi:MAG: hypothetical protein ACFCBW_09270 [Candidatus Competibacterales bacterium]